MTVMTASFGLKLVTVFILHHHTDGMSLPTASPEEQAYNQLDNVDPHFAVDTQNLELSEMAKNIQVISGAVMATAEIAMGIKSDLKLLRGELMMGKMNMRFEGRQHPDHSVSLYQFSNSDLRIRHNLDLAERIEKIFDSDNSTLVNLAKEEIQKTIRINFIRVLAAMLINGPPSTQRRKEDILGLMKSVLNGELDFKLVVDKLPFILKDSETNQFINLIQMIKEEEFPKLIIKGRQEDEDEDGDEDATLAPVAQVVAPAPVPVQETVILVPRPQQQQSQMQQSNAQTVGTQTKNVVGQEGTKVQPPVITKPPTTPTPIRIVVHQPQPQPKPVVTTPPPKSQLNKVIDAVKELDVNQFQSLITNLPDLFAGIDAIVDGVEGFIGDQPSQQISI